MDDEELEPMGEEEHYVAGSKLANYEDFCPITKIWGYTQPDGTFLSSSGDVLPTSDLIPNPGFLIIHLGDSLDKEHTVDSAAEALYSGLFALFSACDVPVDLERIRTATEFSEFMKIRRALYSNLILIGHGSTEGLKFLDKPTRVKGAELAGMMGYDSAKTPLQILSLCCHSGCADISKSLSSSEGVTEVIAPSGYFDLRWAVHFVTGYFLARYINGANSEEALKINCSASKLKTCIWRDGEQTHCTSD